MISDSLPHLTAKDTLEHSTQDIMLELESSRISMLLELGPFLLRNAEGWLSGPKPLGRCRGCILRLEQYIHLLLRTLHIPEGKLGR